MREGKFQDYDLLITNIVTIKTRKLIYNKTIQIAFYPNKGFSKLNQKHTLSKANVTPKTNPPK